MNAKKAKLLRKLISPFDDSHQSQISKRKMYTIAKKYVVENQTSKFSRYALNAWFVDTIILN